MNRKMTDSPIWTPPEPNTERRWVKSPVAVVRRSRTDEQRAAGGVVTMDGIAFTNDRYVLKSWWGDFEERIAPGAAKKTLAEKADVRSLLNHNTDKVLGRTKSGTLELQEVKEGLHTVTIPDMEITHSRDAVKMIDRGDIDQMSFAFRVVKEQWTFVDDPESDELDFREILELELFDISPVTFPANESTSISIGERSMAHVARMALEGSRRAQRMVDCWTQRFEIAPGKPGQENHSDEPGTTHSDEPDPAHSPDRAKRDADQIRLTKVRLAIARQRVLIGGE